MKKLRLSFYITTLLVTLCAFSIKGQDGFNINSGITFPAGAFAYVDLDDDVLNAGGASTGFNIGGKYTYRFNDSRFGVFGSANLHYNPLKIETKDILINTGRLDDDANATYYKYLNVPILLGVSYLHEFGDGFAVFGDFGAGLNFLKLSNLKIEEGEEEYKIVYSTSARLAWKIQAGIVIQEKYSIGLSYLSLGNHDVSAEIFTNSKSDDTFDQGFHM